MRFLIFATLLAVAFAAPAAKNALSGDVARLKDLANVEIKKLESEGKHLLAKELQVLEKELLAVEDRLEHLNPNNELGRIGVHALESVVKSLEHQLEAELKKLGGAYYANTQKNALNEDVKRLKSLTDVEIKKLQSEGKGLLAKELQVLEKELLAAEAKLEHLNPHDELGQIGVHALQSVVKSIEHKLEAELKKLGAAGSFYANDQKKALSEDVNRLKGLANVEIKKLESEGKHLLAKELQVLEKELLAAEAKLEHLNPHDELGKIGVHALQSVVKSIEHQLEAELKKLGTTGSFYANDQKKALSEDVNRLKGLANVEIKKLESEGKHLLAKELQVLEKELLAAEAKLEHLNPHDELGKIGVHALQSVVKSIEHQLEAELKKLGATGSFFDNTKAALEADINRLKKLADGEIKKLESEGKSLLAKELKVLENEIVSVEKQLASVNPNNEVGKIAVSSLKTVLHGLENQLEAQIKKLGGK